MAQVKIGIIGCLGRMGQALTIAALDHEKILLVGATERTASDKIGSILKHPATGEKTAVKISEDTDQLIKNADVILDFTCPTASGLHASLAEKYGTALVIGTTGLSNSHEDHLKSKADKTAIIYASNFSSGVNLLFYLSKIAAGILDEDFDVEILEMHHRDKIDAPSGTALSLGEYAALGRGKDLNDIRRRDILGKRKRGDIGFACLRGGNVAGNHTISFNSDGERIELSHKASDRALFARGAIKAALWIARQKPGLYDMFDMLGLPKD